MLKKTYKITQNIKTKFKKKKKKSGGPRRKVTARSDGEK